MLIKQRNYIWNKISLNSFLVVFVFLFIVVVGVGSGVLARKTIKAERQRSSMDDHISTPFTLSLSDKSESDGGACQLGSHMRLSCILREITYVKKTLLRKSTSPLYVIAVIIYICRGLVNKYSDIALSHHGFLHSGFTLAYLKLDILRSDTVALLISSI